MPHILAGDKVFHMLTTCEVELHPITCETELDWSLMFVLHRQTYSQFAPEGVLANTLGLLLLAYGVLIGYVLTREEFKRPPHPEEEALSVHFKTLTDGGAISP